MSDNNGLLFATFGIRLTGLFFWRSLKLRPKPPKV